MTTNKKLIRGSWIPLTMLAVFMTACSLDIEETDSILTKGESSIFNGVTDVPGQLTAIYNNIKGETESQDNLFALTEVTTDELLVPTRGTDWGDNGVWRTLHVHTYGPTHSQILAVWNHKNSAVLRCTEIIDPKTTSATPLQIAQAKFARAYNMWIVMDFWGQQPFRNPSDGQDVLPTVMTRAQSYDMIVQDLTDAIAGLPASNPTSTDKTMPVKAAARLFLAKVKLNAKVYKGAYGANDLQDVITLVDAIEAEGYTNVSNYFEIFHGPTFTNKDVIWNVAAGTGNRMWNGLHYNQPRLVEPAPGTGNNTGGGWNGFSTLAEFYDKFEGPVNDNSIGLGQEERRGYTHTLASTNAANEGFGFGFQVGQMYGFKSGAAVALKNRTGAPLVFTKEMPGLVGNTEVTGMRLLKYSPANGAFTSGVVMARFADAHLMRAEAMLRLNQGAAALAEVNELRALRTNTPALGSLNEAEMLDERGRELYIEGWRRNDMIRFGVYNAAKEFMPVAEGGDDHTNLFPIPASAILTNPNLVQNPGY